MRYHPPTPDPSEAEIAAACAEIRRTWSPAERRRRQHGGADAPNHARGAPLHRPHWQPPVVETPRNALGQLLVS